MSKQNTESLVLQKEPEEVIEEAWEDAARILEVAALQPKGTEMKGIPEMRKIWAENKAWMLPFFGNSLRIVVETDYSREFTYDEIEQTYSELGNMATNLVSKPDSKYSIFSVDDGREVYLELYNLLRNHFYVEEITENKILRPLWTQEDIKRKFPSGTKLSRFLGTFIECEVNNSDRLSSIYSGEDLSRTATDFMITLYSQLVSMMKTKKSKVVVSIHPVDFLLCSSHAKWGSCHNVFSGGYRTGGISYMLDDVSAIAYSYERKTLLEATGKETPEKLWRQMIYFDRSLNGAVHSREYPGAMPAFSNAAKQITGDILKKLTGIEKKPTILGFVPLSLKGSGFHYQDGATGMVHLSETEDLYSKQLKIGKDIIPCSKCGEERSRKTGEGPGRLICLKCYNEGKPCQACGRKIEEGTDYLWYGDSRYCEECSRARFTECFSCGESHPSNLIYLINGENYCGHCAEDLFWWCEGCEEHHSYDYDDAIHIDGDLFCQDYVDRYFTLCSDCEEYFYSEDMVHLESGEAFCLYCKDEHVGTCDHCEGFFLKEDLSKNNVKDLVCEGCLDQFYVKCEGCGEFYLKEDMASEEFCEECLPLEEENQVLKNPELSTPKQSSSEGEETHYGIEEDDA